MKRAAEVLFHKEWETQTEASEPALSEISALPALTLQLCTAINRGCCQNLDVYYASNSLRDDELHLCAILCFMDVLSEARVLYMGWLIHSVCICLYLIHI